jgi:radical SAM-linked protein
VEHRELSSSRERLTDLLDLMRHKASNLAVEPLARLDAAIEADDALEFASLLPLLQTSCPEEAVERLRRPGRTRTKGMMDLLKALEPHAQQARQRRSARWSLDASRTRLRLRMERAQSCISFDSQDLQILIAEAFHLEGLPLALDLGKHPRPLITFAPALSAGIEGRDEVVEVETKRSPKGDWVARLNRRMPEGLRILQADLLPSWASPAAELAVRAHYQWPCPLPPETAKAALQRFLEASSFFLEKPGKQDGQKTEKRVELRTEIATAEWNGRTLHFTMPLSPGKALSPLKLLGALFQQEPSAIQGLIRDRIELAEDPRLQQGERFETKLKNIYEDATLLTSGGNITLVEEDDDEPMILG